MIKSSKPGGFAKDSYTHQCSMKWYQEVSSRGDVRWKD